MSLKDEVNRELEKACGIRVTDDSAKAISDVCNSKDPETIANVIQGVIPIPNNRR
ncbi:MAG: hypothetical protein KME22_08300 [Hassallia sp. WJT32-NPBG1]|jgi:hypothetical protein|nr:hypothetical protein [Hassallia sp. WJT32-NPBG1]